MPIHTVENLRVVRLSVNDVLDIYGSTRPSLAEWASSIARLLQGEYAFLADIIAGETGLSLEVSTKIAADCVSDLSSHQTIMFVGCENWARRHYYSISFERIRRALFGAFRIALDETKLVALVTGLARVAKRGG